MSPNNRAGCQNKECKDQAIKLAKGELRYAIQVTIKEHSSWQYRHWGCVTPKQIENLIEATEGDTDMVDGYDELPAEFQEKIQYALKNGHVPDEDWKGVSDLSLLYVYTCQSASVDSMHGYMLSFAGCGEEPTWSDRFPCTCVQEEGQK